MNFVMLGIEFGGDLPCVWSFIKLFVVERRTKSAEAGCGQKLTDCAGNSGGVDATRKKSADGNITTQANSYSLPHSLAHPFHGLLHRGDVPVFVAVHGKVGRPETGAHEISTSSDGDRLARSKLSNPLHMRAWGRDITQG